MTETSFVSLYLLTKILIARNGKFPHQIIFLFKNETENVSQ